MNEEERNIKECRRKKERNYKNERKIERKEKQKENEWKCTYFYLPNWTEIMQIMF
jgi:hypothetical protein